MLKKFDIRIDLAVPIEVELDDFDTEDEALEYALGLARDFSFNVLDAYVVDVDFD